MLLRHRRSGSLAAALAAVGAFGLAACSSSPTTSTGAARTSHATGSGSSAKNPVPDGGALVAVTPIPVSDRSPSGTSGTAPTVTVPAGPPPTSLESADLIAGKGPFVTPGDSLTVQYVLASYSAGKVVQSSWTSQPFTFTLSTSDVIPGWVKGLVGMRVGGRRELIIPPSLAYKNRSPGAGIAANDTLVFVVDLIHVN